MRRRAAIAAAVIGVVLLGACGSGSKDEESDTKPATTTTSSAAKTTTTAESGKEGPQAYVDSGNYVTGLHIGYIKSVDKADRKIEFDVVQFLTGDQAVKAYHEDTGESGPPDNDYWLRNQNAQLRDFVLSDDVEIRVNNLGGFPPGAPNEGHIVDFDTFLGYFVDHPDQARNTLFWISLEDGPITHVEEQFVP